MYVVKPGSLVAVTNKIWVSQPTAPTYGATVAALDANDAYGDAYVIDQGVDGSPPPVYGRILSAKLVDRDDVATALTAHLFAAPFAAAASDAAYSVTAEEGRSWITNITFSVMNDEGAVRCGEVNDINSDFYLPDRKFYVQDSTTGTPTPTRSGMPLLQLYVLVLG